MNIPKPVTGDALKAYFMEHVTPLKGSAMLDMDFYRVTKPLHVFKTTHNYGCTITNLIIPKGAIVYAPGGVFQVRLQLSKYYYRKMRASSAFVHSNYTRGTKKKVREAFSIYSPSFKYKEGTVVKPKSGFSREHSACDSGIHFFLNLYDAYHYV